MADSEKSKAAKKNAKRKAAKRKKEGAGTKESSEQSLLSEQHEILEMLKKQLDEAKAEKNHARAGTLRDQIWVLSDMIKGVRTDLPEENLLPIIQAIQSYMTPKESSTSASSAASSATSSSNLTTEEKKIRALRKKLTQIEELKSRQMKSEILEKTQLDKINSEDKIREELEELEELVSSALSLH